MTRRTPPPSPAALDDTPLYGVCDASGNLLAWCDLDQVPALVLWRSREAAERAMPGYAITAMDTTMWTFLAGIEGYSLDIREGAEEAPIVLGEVKP